MERILIIEDEVVIRRALAKLLKREGYDISEASSVTESEELFSLDAFGLIIADLRLPGGLGTEVIEKCAGTPVLIMTSYASINSAVESMKAGAADYIAKPFNHDEMLIVVDRLIRQNLLFRQNQAMRKDIHREYPVWGMVGKSPAMEVVFQRIAKVALTDSTVLIYGESGTGKELVARAIHEQGQRSHGPLVTMNCAAIPDTLVESELFGYERGAFTGADKATAGLVESADRGTLFLDEVAELSATAQAGLLRVIQEGELRRLGSNRVKNVDVRVLAATHRNLVEQVENGLFREDLLYRLQVIEITLPPLRERKEDLPALTDHLLHRICQQLNRSLCEIPAKVHERIAAYHWPGNVRELENAIERAVILCDGNTIVPELLNLGRLQRQETKTPDQPMASLDAYFVEFVQQHQGQMTETELARKLGISRKTLWERRQRFEIPRAKTTSLAKNS
ncbi:MAG: sigma-54-dependent Fis family transcriptional regulator [Acidiferrobacteraceae bacterium]|jgi:DNA-binding NtrC family response regulator|nr:sigma-54-dependent Fis family transcriptional regulator [Acidiferrobacteraceae bacterium]MBT3639605.1 sigma-54-dependent Fis family transcriptional regulator [Acidiferrobacteraceae bacterium]MBT3769479.1 sigma-54-dependent Fis family transcriptional regulator [Acidiferrobacteraceae bacterium]MBT3973720.1 sigma-54-dependent Fis family transcriptional regulator [Acidiferrobacteraceae bacterium]MBT4403980.1 sigma-54-dependent Fis family transcriptional regulator [Acidiferrobacteraceae bacterium